MASEWIISKQRKQRLAQKNMCRNNLLHSAEDGSLNDGFVAVNSVLMGITECVTDG